MNEFEIAESVLEWLESARAVPPDRVVEVLRSIESATAGFGLRSSEREDAHMATLALMLACEHNSSAVGPQLWDITISTVVRCRDAARSATAGPQPDNFTEARLRAARL
jgi:hypothetical protein